MKHSILLTFLLVLLPACSLAPATQAGVKADIAAIKAEVVAVAKQAEEDVLGWMEILGAGLVLAGGTAVGVNKHRNGTRATDPRVANKA